MTNSKKAEVIERIFQSAWLMVGLVGSVGGLLYLLNTSPYPIASGLLILATTIAMYLHLKVTGD